MIILDENIIDSQRRQLCSWRMRVYQIGHEVGRKGMMDKEIIPCLSQLHGLTFFTRDDNFYQRKLCHAGYCLVILDVRQAEVEAFIRRLLRHQEFKTKINRMGKVIRADHAGLSVWDPQREIEQHFRWNS